MKGESSSEVTTFGPPPGGDWAIFSDGGTTPSTMAAARVALAVAALQQLEVTQTDCLRAYVQGKLDGPPTFISMP